MKKRLADSIETALQTGGGVVIVTQQEKGDASEQNFSENYACIDCGVNIIEIEPRTFSFNSPYGACPSCNGLGTKMEIDPLLLVPDPSKFWVNAIAPAKKGRRGYLMYYRAVMRELADHLDIELEQPFSGLSKKHQKNNEERERYQKYREDKKI